MHKRKGMFLTAAGSLAMAVGLGLRNWPQGNHIHFVIGFLMGLAITFLVGGLVLSRRVSR
jgi:hypothetical protein